MRDNEEMDRVQFLFEERTEMRVLLAKPRTPRTIPPLQFLDFIEQINTTSPPSLNGSLGTFSTVSSQSRPRYSDMSSRKSATVTIASSVTAPHEGYNPLPSLEQELLNLPDSHYQLPCEFSIIGCTDSFHPLYHDRWMAHTLSHFHHNNSPPSETFCIFCNTTFNRFKRGLDAAENWQLRMEHIHNHFRGGVTADSARPDFHVIDHMYAKSLISPEDYKHPIEYTGRPECPDIVPHGWEPEEKKMKKQRDQQQPHDLEREMRMQRRANRTQKGKGKELYPSSRRATALM